MRLATLTLAVVGFSALAMQPCAAQQVSPFANEAGASAGALTYSAYERRLSELEAEVATLRNTQSIYSRYGGSDSCCDSCLSDRCCEQCCADAGCALFKPGFVFGGEAVFLSPNSSTGLGPSPNAAFPNDGMYASWRSWLGFVLPSGVGLRGRFWEFDQLITNDINGFTYALDANVADMEMTIQSTNTRDWDFLLSGGVRHLEFNEARTIPAIGAQPARTAFVDSGLTGIVVGGELRRTLIGGLRAFGTARTSALFGDADGEVPPPFVLAIDGRTVFTWECQLGLEYAADTPLGTLSARVGAEVQYWDEISYRSDPIASKQDSESLGFVGVLTGLTLRR